MWPTPWWPTPWWPTSGTVTAAPSPAQTVRKAQKPSIPSPMDSGFNNAVKENLEIITGRRPGVPKVVQLPSTASTDEVIAKINELLTRLQ